MLRAAEGHFKAVSAQGCPGLWEVTPRLTGGYRAQHQTTAARSGFLKKNKELRHGMSRFLEQKKSKKGMAASPSTSPLLRTHL